MDCYIAAATSSLGAAHLNLRVRCWLLVGRLIYFLSLSSFSFSLITSLIHVSSSHSLVAPSLNVAWKLGQMDVPCSIRKLRSRCTLPVVCCIRTGADMSNPYNYPSPSSTSALSLSLSIYLSLSLSLLPRSHGSRRWQTGKSIELSHRSNAIFHTSRRPGVGESPKGRTTVGLVAMLTYISDNGKRRE